MTVIAWNLEQLQIPTHWATACTCPHGNSAWGLWFGTGVIPNGLGLMLEAVQNHRRLLASCDCDAPQPGVATLAGECRMPELGGSEVWDTLEDQPLFAVGQTVMAAGGGVLVLVGINESTQGRLTVRNDGAEGNAPPGTVLPGGTKITAV